MGFCTPAEKRSFLEAVPGFERMLVDQGITLFKFYLDIGREMQLKRLYDRRHDPLKRWKLSPVDVAAITKWDDYTRAPDEMLRSTHRPDVPGPWSAPTTSAARASTPSARCWRPRLRRQGPQARRPARSPDRRLRARVLRGVTFLVDERVVNVIANVRYPELLDALPVIGAAVWVVLLVTAPWKRPDWEVMPETFKAPYSCWHS